jgi:hypothetical protein
MTAREERVHADAGALRDAVKTLTVGQPPANRLLGDLWPNLAKECIVGWVDDAEYSCVQIGRALDMVDAGGESEEGEDAIETALWRITATREKLEAVFVLCFGIPSLEPYKQTSARFEPNTDGIRAKLRELAPAHQVACELGEVGKQLAEHRGVTLRDQLSHQLAAVTSVQPLCWIDIAHMQGNSIVAWSGGPFYGANTIDQGSIERDAVWERATTAVEECFKLLIRSFELMAELVRDAAVLEPPQRVYKDEATGAVTTTNRGSVSK